MLELRELCQVLRLDSLTIQRVSSFLFCVLQLTDHERALKEFQCKLCSGVLQQPISTPCGHHFCKPCIEQAFKVTSLPRARPKRDPSHRRGVKCALCSMSHDHNEK